MSASTEERRAPDQDKLEFRKAPAQYHHVLCMSRALLGGLPHCTWHPAKGWWSSQTAKLMTPLATTFWSEHGDRAVLASWGAAMRMDKATLDRLGRWSPSGSEAYVRTSLSVVSKAQKDIAERVRSSRGGIDWLGEQEVLAQLRKHLLDEGLETTAAEDVIDNLRFFQKTGACYDPATIAEAAVEAEQGLQRGCCRGPRGGWITQVLRFNLIAVETALRPQG